LVPKAKEDGMKIERRPGADLTPSPVVLVTVGDGEAANIITIGWVGVVNSEPPMVGISVRPSRHSYPLLCAAREFVVNVPRAADVARVDAAGVLSGDQLDKFAELGFTRAPASEVGAPLIVECPVNLECVVRYQLALGTHDLFVAEVVASHFDAEVLDERGNFRPSAEVGLALHGFEYWSLGQKLGGYGSFGKAWRERGDADKSKG
jgi:flavin reductase (DIM6/NTAB) family NADH-FMN oxidoreductase RutF